MHDKGILISGPSWRKVAREGNTKRRFKYARDARLQFIRTTRHFSLNTNESVAVGGTRHTPETRRAVNEFRLGRFISSILNASREARLPTGENVPLSGPSTGNSFVDYNWFVSLPSDIYFTVTSTCVVRRNRDGGRVGATILYKKKNHAQRDLCSRKCPTITIRILEPGDLYLLFCARQTIETTKTRN